MNLVPSGIDLFLDSESFLSELTEEETAKTVGGFGNVNFNSEVGQAVLAEGNANFNSSININL